MLLLASTLALIYGVLSAFAGLTQLRTRRMQIWSAIGMIVVGLLLAASSLFIHSVPNLLYLLIICLVLMHVFAIINGIHLFGKIHFKHHLIRLFFSCLIILFYLYSID